MQEQAKKKARAERFGTATGAAAPAAANGASTGAAKLVASSEEEEKRKARALRFATGLPPAKAESSGTTAEQASPPAQFVASLPVTIVPPALPADCSKQNLDSVPARGDGRTHSS